MKLRDALPISREDDRYEFRRGSFQNDSFRIVFPNKWEMSLGYGTFHLCTNNGPRMLSEKTLLDIAQNYLFDTENIELAIFNERGKYFWAHEDTPFEDSFHTGIWAYIPIELALKVIDAVSMMPGGLCPCPPCVEKRYASGELLLCQECQEERLPSEVRRYEVLRKEEDSTSDQVVCQDCYEELSKDPNVISIEPGGGPPKVDFVRTSRVSQT